GAIAAHAGRVALSGQVVCERDVPCPEAVDAAVAEADLDLTLERDHVLTARRGMPVDEVAWGRDTKEDAFGCARVGQLGVVFDADPLDVRLKVVAGVQARD